MRILTKKNGLRVLVLVVMIAAWLMGAGAARAGGNGVVDPQPLLPPFPRGKGLGVRFGEPADQALAEKFAPVLYFHPSELFRPQAVDGFIDSARLRENRRFWFDINLLPHVSLADLAHYLTPLDFLDSWFGSQGISDSMNYESHRTYYEQQLSPDAGGSPILTYAHVDRSENPGFITIQYWLFYYYNDWFNKHEGDWEMVEVILSQAGEPQWVILSQHHGGTRRPWSTARIEDATHPVVYPAVGSHANYFWSDEAYPNGMNIGSTRVEIMDRTGSTGRVIPPVTLIPDPAVEQADPAAWSSVDWVLFGGHWGETTPQGDFSGPLGPAYKGDQWSKPYAWGMAQPLDTDTWYTQRLRVELAGGAEILGVTSSTGGSLASLEVAGATALLHRDLVPGETIQIKLQITGSPPGTAAITLPDSLASQVTRYRYDLSFLESNNPLILSLTPGKDPLFTQAGVSLAWVPTSREVETFNWQTPDLIWLPGLVSVSDLLKGLLYCLLAAWLPSLLYVGLLYWADRYEKEPLRLVAAAFLWGAIPALLIALALRIFVRLPPDLLGARAMENVNAGLITPLVEETLKDAVVVFIAWRFRDEFDDILDGIIYGGVVGLGFAMNANLISYLGSFLTRGFAGLGNIILSQGVIYGLDHAFYSALFGAGLGFARLASKRWQKWAIPLGAYLVSVFSQGVHNLLLVSAVGLTPWSVAVSLVGVLVIIVAVGWSFRRQQGWLQSGLVDVLPAGLYQVVIRPRRRFQAEWRILLGKGFGAWRKVRRLHQVCAEFAFKRMQARLFPGDEKIAGEMEALRGEIERMS